MSDDTHTVAEAMEQFQEYDWLANCDQNKDGSWKMLYAPSADPSDETLEAFWEDMDYLMESDDLDHVTEIGNGWFVIPEEAA